MVIYGAFIIIAFIIDSPKEIILGLKEIIISPDILITDYVELGGIGASLVNSGLTSIFSILILVINKIKPNGATIMSLWLMTGFAFFGKNILNIWPIIIGVFIYSEYQKEPFLNYSLVALLSTTLAPAVSQLAYTNHFSSKFIAILIGYGLGILIGFIIAPISSHVLKSHSGFNLYNVGFAGGLLATIFMSLFRLFGIKFESRLIWHTGSNLFFSILIFSICFLLIFVGLYHNPHPKENLKSILKEPGRLVTDYYLLFGETCYINMGMLGILSTTLVLILGADLNGPTISGIFTIIGFGALGKHLRNVIPILIGAILCGFISESSITSPSIIISVLFSTALAPIAGKYGYFIGIIAGFLHVSTVVNVGYLHGGLNLYNNGLAAGFVAMVLIPVVNILKKES
ncbi:DUF1576 domain-containing protein [Clostridium sp.]|uniref:DUF1576 domain-containing protein n=1 Tax=Clostridium sp. TaxID=1506 RepID=UPI002607ED06|nr:DUF1576 domain-containing protein [Clostridium sp.]